MATLPSLAAQRLRVDPTGTEQPWPTDFFLESASQGVKFQRLL